MAKTEKQQVGIPVTHIAHAMFCDGDRYNECFDTNVKDKGWNRVDYMSFCTAHGYTMVKATSLNINYRYQRANINRTVINDICKNFDMRLLRPIKVSGRSNSILDGQHTAIACVRRGLRMLPVIWVNADSEEEEAELFIKYNLKHNRVPSSDIFKAQAAAGDPVACAIQDLLQRLGLYTVKSTYTKGHGIQGVNTLLEYGRKSLENTMTAIELADKMCPNQVMAINVFKGMFWLLEQGVDMRKHMPRLLAKLEKYKAGMTAQDALTHLVQLREFSLSIRDTRRTPFGVGELYGTIMLEVINKGASRGRVKIKAGADE